MAERLNNDYEVVGYRPVGAPDQEDLADALRRHEAACRPADTDRIIKDLAALRLSCASRGMSEADIKMQTQVYAHRLSEWPADAVLAALREWPSRSRWFPTWCEIECVVREHCGRRLMRRDALRQMHDGEASPDRDRRTVGNITYADPQAADNRRRVRGAEMADLGGLADRLRAGIERDGTQEAD